MDFLLKKMVSAFLMPLPIGVLLLLLGILFLVQHKTQKARVTLFVSVLWLFLFSYSPFSNALLHTIESGYPTLHQAPQDVKYIYVLGSGHTTDESQPITSQVGTVAVIRLNEGIRLYHQLQGKAKLILSGYSGGSDLNSHAAMQEKLALALGIQKTDILLSTEPRDTEEEAIAAQKICGDEKFILVTSASHMQRAMKFFTHIELNPIPAPTNHMASTQHPDYTDTFSSIALIKSSIVFHESIGMLWQKIKGI